MTTIQIERYSNSGFKPLKQKYHLKKIHSLVIPFEYTEKSLYKYYKQGKLNKNLYQMLLKSKQEEHLNYSSYFCQNFQDFVEGIWVFPIGKKEAFLLNHLKTEVKKNIGTIDNKAEAYSFDFKEKGTVVEILNKYGEAYLPKRSCEKIKPLKIERSKDDD